MAGTTDPGNGHYVDPVKGVQRFNGGAVCLLRMNLPGNPARVFLTKKALRLT